MQSKLRKLEKANIQIAAISYDDVDVLKKFASDNEITFPLISDSTADKKSRTISDYQLLDPRESGRYGGVPIPTTVVVDQKKKVRLVLRGSIKKRHNVEELTRRIMELGDQKR